MSEPPEPVRRWGGTRACAMLPASRHEFKQALIGLVEESLRSRRLVCAVPIEGSTRLFEDGLVDSLGVLELIAFVEEVVGQNIPTRMVDLKYFGSIDRICDTFWQNPSGGGV